jgi:hypothetical protein
MLSIRGPFGVVTIVYQASGFIHPQCSTYYGMRRSVPDRRQIECDEHVVTVRREGSKQAPKAPRKLVNRLSDDRWIASSKTAGLASDAFYAPSGAVYGRGLAPTWF